MNNKYELIYEGKAKKVFTHNDRDKVKIEFKDDATAFSIIFKFNFYFIYIIMRKYFFCFSFIY